MKEVGILMPVASLPSDDGIGDFGEESYRFIDRLSKVGIDIWQILPLNPLGYGNSPYQPYSSYAGDEIYISLEQLVQEGLLSRKEQMEKSVQLFQTQHKESKRILYDEVRKFKQKYLKLAYSNFTKNEEYEQFIQQTWVYPYAVFLTLKKKNNLICWNKWPKDEQNVLLEPIYGQKELEPYIQYEIFVQYLFFHQWKQLKAYANQNHIRIMGDLPFYVGIDSQDVWENQEEFLLDEEKRPAFVAGVPPDYFSKTGQRWGNPIYNWEVMKRNKYKFWTNRLLYCNKMFDITRIDHFRAFDTYWKIPASCATAITGEWVLAPGREFFQSLQENHKEIVLVVEDLGDIRTQVYELRDAFGLKGMQVLQFVFDPKEVDSNIVDRENMILYTGTHDNQTMRGWFEAQEEEIQFQIRKKMKQFGYHDPIMSWNFVQMALDSVAQLVIIPYQDFVDYGEDCRINTPGTLGSPNWEWRIANYSDMDEKMPRIQKAIKKRKNL